MAKGSSIQSKLAQASLTMGPGFNPSTVLCNWIESLASQVRTKSRWDLGASGGKGQISLRQSEIKEGKGNFLAGGKFS